ncbi:MAG: alpha-L-fucosidase [Haliscomenobacter sp.]|uniref:alpha-L-fucosidase n=1 Tax=Haliscomenobacter sp. TaxID=2717303 RepID=UPI0029BC949F|nr:alpha-L-fucosidase [Haliscomenobacter sp.]MDX2068756.1 alpha-L-fucosidase [Haliscomenobacter sp.]
MKQLLIFSLALLINQVVFSQQHAEQNHSKYVPPTDPLVQQKLQQWQTVKFGLLMHWGTYSQWGIVESWSLCPEDEGWCERRGPYANDWYGYKKAYENLQSTFNPTDFNPDKWATAAKAAGMKYLVFTTKHHDGFCMFDTKQTDYSVMNSPFGKNPKANIANEVFKSFRDQDFMIGAYFSKPDWHTPDYWWPYFPPKDRNSSYPPKKYPEKWEKFKTFTYNQIEELMRDYGKMDILWLDGGWVRPFSTIDTSVSWQKTIPFDQDIDMPKIAAMARTHQPGLLVVDRTVTGPYENYVTPEQQIPSHYMPIPWETCLTMGDSWSYIPKENFKPARKLIHILADVVSKNGNLLLNIAPSPQGDFHPEAYDRLKEIGNWMNVNSEAIYGTTGDKDLGPQGKLVFTHKGKTIYAIYRAEEGEALPVKIEIKNLTLSKKASINLLGNKDALRWSTENGTTSIVVPEKTTKLVPNSYAYVFKITDF